MPQADLAHSAVPAFNGANDSAGEWSAFPGDEIVPQEGGLHVHDPTIIQFDNRYFCFSTTHDGFGVMRSSLDLRRWMLHDPIFANRPEWLEQRIPQHGSIWAPDAIRGPKRSLRLYYCASERFG